MQALQRAEVPARDLYSIAARLRFKSTDPIPNTIDQPSGDYTIGRTDLFNIADLGAKRYYTVSATIQEVTEHAYWYAEDGRSVDLNAVKRIASTFESSIYPTNQRLFGSEWTPGVDNDPRMTVLFTSIPGAGGYFSSADEHTRTINPYSNEREIIYVNIDNGWSNLENTLAHEHQHMIHWNNSPSHDVWLNEGSSMLAQALNGYALGGVDDAFMRNPDTQLTGWAANPDLARANYGAAYLFLDYLRTYYGGDGMIRSIVATPGAGFAAIDRVLEAGGYSERFVDVFEKWALTNLLDGTPGAAEDDYEYPNQSIAVSLADNISSYPADLSATVSQFGTDYIQIAPPPSGSTLEINFTGATEAPVIATDARSGEGIYWSNRGDMSDTMLTRSFDLSSVQSASLEYAIWFDLEQDLDYGYVEASTDGGATWDTLRGNHTTDTNPNGTNFGHGYTGSSSAQPGADAQGWLTDSVDLTPYVGGEVQVRFEYITDDGYNAGGLALDDISLEAINWQDDAESDAGWQEAGWVRVANTLPQTYYVALVLFADDGTYSIRPMELAEGNTGRLTIDEAFDTGILLVAGTTPFSLQNAEYTLRIDVGE